MMMMMMKCEARGGRVKIMHFQVGLEIQSVSYKSSQHWPFPAGSVMIGMVASLPIGPDSKQ